jgi:photosystem II stability/assembly factor-like uncharacterized protein
MRAMRLLLLLLLFSSSAEAQWWKVQTSGIDTNLRGVSAAYTSDAKGVPVPVVWVSGSNGVILRSLDEGKTWKRLHVADGDTLDFRGIVAFNGTTAYVMSSGEGEKSRIYKTTDGGETWKRQYTDKRNPFFLDALACWSEKECLALSDPVDGKFLLLHTADGEHWNALPSDSLPAALTGEGAFAASNSSLALSSRDEFYFATGGTTARVFHTADLGLNWTVTETPVAHGKPSAGIFSIIHRYFADTNQPGTLLVVGGDYQTPAQDARVCAYSTDGGKTWHLSKQGPGGYRSAVGALDNFTFFAVGPNGEELSRDQGAHWKHTDSLNLNAITFLDGQHGWAVGPKGTIAIFVNRLQYEIRREEPDRESGPATSAIAE